MSETTYTLRDLNRTPAKVLKACDLYGHVTIRTRTGKTYHVQAETSPDKVKPEDIVKMFREHHKNMRKLGYVPPAPDEIERINRIIAGEE
ncbi:MAG: hypothetical protein WCT04_10420 [Planctomycetota bacterium]